jgi:hypothetical protein
MFWLVNKLGQFVYHWRRAWSCGCVYGHSVPKTSANGMKNGEKFHLLRNCSESDVDVQALNRALQEDYVSKLHGGH